MTGEGSEHRDKGKGVARPKTRQRQAPNTPSSYPCSTPSSYPCSTPSSTPTTDILPPPVIITLTAPPDPTSIPSSSCIPPSEIATPYVDPDSPGDGDGVDLPLHDRPWIQPYGMPVMQGSALTGWVSTFGTLYSLIGIQQSFAISVLQPRGTELLKRVAPCILAQALGWAVHVDRVFAQTHVQKGTNQFVDERSRKTHEEFSTSLSMVRSEHGSAPTPDGASNEDDDIRRTQC
ncbi:hypothetical protein LR48_Vigan02g069500 [Vigna angularis]|uniref:Uncharacterized protein n=1 Tax=Phaseolus angularis TaxID=3914 RepID=A0A0L9TVH0_PHAAN|nr:hypothetical protein LR48_Vigan02g069500 [Vigna angularis]